MRNLFQKLQTAMLGNRPPAGRSKDSAKQRLKFLLIHDQVDLSATQLDSMKDEIMEVIGRYLEVDTNSVEFRLNREDGQIALVSSIPVRRVTGARA